MPLSPAQARLDLAIMHAKTQEFDQTTIFAHFTNQGLPPEVVLRLEELWNLTRVVGGKTVDIGKIILARTVEFMQAHRHLVVGIALGAAFGALVNLVPFLGPLLAPITIALGALYGGVAGAMRDRDQISGDVTMTLTQGVIALAVKFFELLAEIFNVLKEEIERC